MLEEEIKAQAEKTCIMPEKNDRACYVAGYLGGHADAETERQEYEKKAAAEQPGPAEQNSFTFTKSL
jgi:hypothetical protein